jgi:hypothetical protein
LHHASQLNRVLF